MKESGQQSLPKAQQEVEVNPGQQGSQHLSHHAAFLCKVLPSILSMWDTK
jgi:hypothetical protein